MLKYFIVFILPVLLLSCGGAEDTRDKPATPQARQQPSAEKQEKQTMEGSMMAQGKSIYNKYCLVCHQVQGEGVPGLYPPISETEWVSGDKERLITIVLEGQEGPIEVKGETYNNIMPAQDFLSNQEVAAVLTYIRQNFGNNASKITPEEVEEVREKLKEAS